MKLFLATALLLSSIACMAANKLSNDTTVCFRVSLDCEACKQKIEKNIAFEKGVKALDISFKEKTVFVTYNKQKNSAEMLKQAIEKLKYKVEIMEEKKIMNHR